MGKPSDPRGLGARAKRFQPRRNRRVADGRRNGHVQSRSSPIGLRSNDSGQRRWDGDQVRNRSDRTATRRTAGGAPDFLCTPRRSLARCRSHHAAKHRIPRDKGDECRSAPHRLALFPKREGATTILASIGNPECRETETLFREVIFFLRCLEYKTWQAQGGLEAVALCENLGLIAPRRISASRRRQVDQQ
jgi:hypothetical protein